VGRVKKFHAIACVLTSYSLLAVNHHQRHVWKQAMDLKDASVNSLRFSLRIHCVLGVTFYGSEQRENKQYAKISVCEYLFLKFIMSPLQGFSLHIIILFYQNAAPPGLEGHHPIAYNFQYFASGINISTP
jgi:hypothetical protein